MDQSDHQYPDYAHIMTNFQTGPKTLKRNKSPKKNCNANGYFIWYLKVYYECCYLAPIQAA